MSRAASLHQLDVPHLHLGHGVGQLGGAVTAAAAFERAKFLISSIIIGRRAGQHLLVWLQLEVLASRGLALWFKLNPDPPGHRNRSQPLESVVARQINIVLQIESRETQPLSRKLLALTRM